MRSSAEFKKVAMVTLAFSIVVVLGLVVSLAVCLGIDYISWVSTFHAAVIRVEDTYGEEYIEAILWNGWERIPWQKEKVKEGFSLGILAYKGGEKPEGIEGFSSTSWVSRTLLTNFPSSTKYFRAVEFKFDGEYLVFGRNSDVWEVRREPLELYIVFNTDNERYWPSHQTGVFPNDGEWRKRVKPTHSLVLLAYDGEGKVAVDYDRIYPPEGMKENLEGNFFRYAEIVRLGDRVLVKMATPRPIKISFIR